MVSSSRLFCSIPPFFFSLQSETWSFWSGKECIFFFFSCEKSCIFFTVLFQSCCCFSEINPLLLPALAGQRDRSRGWGTIRFPCISPQRSRAGESRSDSEVKYCHEENTSLACMWKLTTPGACKRIFVWKELVPRGLSRLWGAARGGCWRGKGGLRADPSVQMTGTNGPGMLQLRNGENKTILFLQKDLTKDDSTSTQSTNPSPPRIPHEKVG